MSKVAHKQEKVTIEEDKSSKAFENAPKLFSKWSYDDIKVPPTPRRSKTLASSTTSPPNPSRLKFLSLTLQADIKLKSSEKLFAPSSRDSSDQCNSMDATLVRKSRPSVSSDIPSKLSTCSQAETLCRCLWVQFCRLALARTRPELELAVW